jgi:hypothetical protein
MPRTVTARTAIQQSDVVVVNTVTNDARPADGGTRKITIGDSHQLSKALADIPEGHQGPVEDLSPFRVFRTIDGCSVRAADDVVDSGTR